MPLVLVCGGSQPGACEAHMHSSPAFFSEDACNSILIVIVHSSNSIHSRHRTTPSILMNSQLSLRMLQLFKTTGEQIVDVAGKIPRQWDSLKKLCDDCGCPQLSGSGRRQSDKAEKAAPE